MEAHCRKGLRNFSALIDKLLPEPKSWSDKKRATYITILALAPCLMGPVSISFAPVDVYHGIGVKKFEVSTDCGSYIPVYKLLISSTDRSFQNYRTRYESTHIKISNDLHDIYPLGFSFENKEKLIFSLTEDEYKKLLDASSFTVYYPTEVFDQSWAKSIWEPKNQHVPVKIMNTLYLYSNFSSQGLEKLIPQCKTEFESFIEEENKKREESKPLNKLKSLFNNW